jgi:hypothetical protein
MRISRVTISGFRGFNDAQELIFDSKLTLISAPNSYGKTSISEALEWVIQGVTSKVEQADSKDEYKGSYRNIHLLPGANPHVVVVLSVASKDTELRAELAEDGTKRFVDGVEVQEWPFHAALAASPNPFILQHALKDLLLASPVERFESFARLLGLSDLGQIHKDLIALCTKPPIPPKVKVLISEVEALEARVAGRSQFAAISKSLRKGIEGIDNAYELVDKQCVAFVPAATPSPSLLPKLLEMRDQAVKKFFSGTLELPSLSAAEEAANTVDEQILAHTLTSEFIERYASLVKLKAIAHVNELAELFELGDRFLSADPTFCPLCERPLDQPTRESIHQKHASLVDQKKEYRELDLLKSQVESSLTNLGSRLQQHYERHNSKPAVLIALEPTLDSLRALLVPAHQTNFDSVWQAILALTKSKGELQKYFNAVQIALGKVQQSIENSDEGTSKATDLSTAIAAYLGASTSFKVLLKSHAATVAEAAQVLKYKLDSLAGTQDVSVLIDLLQQRRAVRKKHLVDTVLNELKELKQKVDKFVSQMMLDAISGEFGAEVMEWYQKIRTAGDPDVHFAGFDMKRTAQGGRVQVKAHSYGKDLVSAVSSLSESKLNALGLCINIAVNVKTVGLFDFLVIDDPIQSWDAEHETKFIEVIKELVQRGKQVVLLSHNHQWIKQVRAACADLNGIAYEITSFTKSGPQISEKPWAEIEQRFSTIKGIFDNPNADNIAIQQGEEEVRLVLTQLAVDLYYKKKGVRKSANNLNASKTKELLLAGGISADLANKLISSFDTVDSAHHSASNYSANRDRLRTYYDWLKSLQQEVKK